MRKQTSKKIFLLIFLAIGFGVYADTITLEQARVVGNNFLRQKSMKTDRTFSLQPTAQKFGFKQFYIFDANEGEGFVIVATHDQVPPIIGYSLENPFVLDSNLNAQYWLSTCEKRLEHLCQYSSTNEEAHQQWQQLLADKPLPPKYTGVGPLLSDSWGQGDLYNIRCPLEEGSNVSAVGCVAVSMAQIMRYWQFPLSGIGEHRYYHYAYGLQQANFDSTEYHYELMPDQLDEYSTPKEIDAVATLLYHCGVSVNMDYTTPSGSAAYSSKDIGFVPCSENAYVWYFDYRPTIHSVRRYDVSDEEWKDLLIEELDHQRPVQYVGGGHSYVCDGYDEQGLFHFNYGWNGYDNGFYSIIDYINRPVPENEKILIGIEPNRHLRVTPQEITLPKEGGNSHITIRSQQYTETVWHAWCDQTWVTLSHTDGATGYDSLARVGLTFEPNNTGAARTAIISITKDGDTVQCSLTQAGCSETEKCHYTIATNFGIPNDSPEDIMHSGWGRAALQFCNETGAIMATVCPDDGDTARTFDVGICPEPLILTWHSGLNDEQIDFKVYTPNGELLIQHQRGSAFDSDTLLALPSPCGSETDSVDISDPTAAGIRITSLNQQVAIDDAQGHAIAIYNSIGQLLHYRPSKNVTAHQNFFLPKKGVYFVHIEGFAVQPLLMIH